MIVMFWMDEIGAFVCCVSNYKLAVFVSVILSTAGIAHRHAHCSYKSLRRLCARSLNQLSTIIIVEHLQLIRVDNACERVSGLFVYPACFWNQLQSGFASLPKDYEVS